MTYDEFITVVAQAARIGWEDAERAARATLETLGERIASGEARDLAEQLPSELAPYVATSTPAEGFDRDEFIRRVAEREGTDLEAAALHARAVFVALRRAVSSDEWQDMVAEFPRDFSPLVGERTDVEMVSAEIFLKRVADRAGLFPDQARAAAEAVLETLAERIAGGEVDDLMARLPAELHPPLERGKSRAGGKATPMSWEGFVDRVAEREGVDTEWAEDHARAVLRTLREAVGEDEWLDVAVQLPREYATALAAR